jgi:hypothetical protein
MPRCPCPDSTRGAETPRRASSAHDAPSRGAGCVSSERPLPRLAGIGHSPSEIQPLLPSLPVLPGTAAAARGWLAWSQHDLAKRYWPKWATRDFERGHWSQIDREPRAPPKFQGSPWSLSLPLWGLASRERQLSRQQLIVGSLKRTFYCLILTGQRMALPTDCRLP